MKKSLVPLIIILLANFTYSSCEKSSDLPDQDTELLITEQEKSDLLFMREEEKLARDVYLYLYDKYEVNIFKNISSSEQTHMDYVLDIMEKYGIEDPASSELGVFNNEALQTLYDDLISQGDRSLEDAFTVGAIIEDVDIRDLGEAISNTSMSDIKQMYERLKCGSENHMRAFNRQLQNINSSYTPQFISQQVFDSVISGDHSHCG